jgi:hypothetical protein
MLLEHYFFTRKRFSSSARKNRMKRYFCAPFFCSLQGEDSPPAPEGTEWKGIFMLLELYFLTRRRFFSNARGNKLESIFTLLEHHFSTVRLSSSARRNRMERYFYAPRTLFSLQGEDSPPTPEGREWKGIFTLVEDYFLQGKILLQCQKEHIGYFYAPQHHLLTRKRFSSSAKRNRIEMCYYAPRTLFPARQIISPTPKGSE